MTRCQFPSGVPRYSGEGKGAACRGEIPPLECLSFHCGPVNAFPGIQVAAEALSILVRVRLRADRSWINATSSTNHVREGGGLRINCVPYDTRFHACARNR